jgi:hypothetical protein
MIAYPYLVQEVSSWREAKLTRQMAKEGCERSIPSKCTRLTRATRMEKLSISEDRHPVK